MATACPFGGNLRKLCNRQCDVCFKRSVASWSHETIRFVSGPDNKEARQVTRSSGKMCEWHCSTCGNIWKARPNDLIGRKSGCPGCKTRMRKRKAEGMRTNPKQKHTKRLPVFISSTHVIKPALGHKKLVDKVYVRIVDGRVIGSCCGTCTRNVNVGIREFCPSESRKNNRRRAKFLDAVASLERGDNSDEVERLVRTIVKTRNGRCQFCQPQKLSPKLQACLNFWNELRTQMCKQNNGCCNQNCQERGPNAVHVLQGDHLGEKMRNLSEYTWWAYHGGVPAMKKECGLVVHDGVWETTNMSWPCAFCHRLEKTTSSSHRYDEATIKDNGRDASGKIIDFNKYDKSRVARIIVPKQRYVDCLKYNVGKCESCGREVTPDNVWAFDWDHINAATKMCGPNPLLARGKCGVGPIAANSAKRARLHSHVTIDGERRTVRGWLLRERLKCRLLCHSCHMRHTHDKPPFAR